MKRVALLSLLAIVVLAAGCGTPTPPQGWEPPKIVAVDMSTTPVAAGSEFLVSIVVSDDHSVARVGYSFVYDRFALRVPCDEADWEPGPVVTVELTCTMPAVAPNGEWSLNIEATDGVWAGPPPDCGCGWSRTPFTVTGGTEDHEPPVISHEVWSPQPYTVGTPFTVSFRVTDDHPYNWAETLSVYHQHSGGGGLFCEQTTHTVLSPTEQEWVITCPGAPRAEERHFQLTIRDEIGFPAYIRKSFDVVAP